ncbi:MAG: hypothetical protein BWY31_00554 [Lentisphaerae bacterium ADurb.Bin242]|nr:MAG: hypothetical protein BWY31_00554 [Lentisphaerae bacterium ADurb.Bin242]
MESLDEITCLEPMLTWLNALPQFLRKAGDGMMYYGTGESASWTVQSNQNIFGALAVLATSENLEKRKAPLPMGKEEIADTARALLRYSLSTHQTGSVKATDGKQWGRHWISVLGMERMTHGVNAFREYLSEEDRAALRRIILDEADWRLDQYEIVADPDASTGHNKPESNIWNGGLLFRAAFDYPDAPRHEEYLEKGRLFLLNGISHPSDRFSETLYSGRPLREGHIGANFTENYSLDHHGYMNVGYSIICLSNIAMLHFNFKERGQTAPPELYLHVEDLWNVVKHFFFPDGRLLRIGGDSRVRYAYCQAYALPVLVLMQDRLRDAEAASLEAGLIRLIRKEQNETPDGSFYGKRLAVLRDKSYFYYTRLESDPFLALSCSAYWRRKFPLLQPEKEAVRQEAFAWGDDFHGADLIRNPAVIRSFVRNGAQGPTALCVPADRSDLAEWQRNLVFSPGLRWAYRPNKAGVSHRKAIPGGFLHCGSSLWQEQHPLGEGEEAYPVLESRSAAAALPDGHSMILLEYVKVIKETTLYSGRGISLKIPNDVYNGHVRKYEGKSFKAKLSSYPGQDEMTDTRSPWLLIDGVLGIAALYGADSLKIVRSAGQSIELHHARSLTSLYADEICGTVAEGPAHLLPGTVLADTGCLVSAALSVPQMERLYSSVRQPETEGAVRAVELTALDGRTCLFAANFGDAAAVFQNVRLAPLSAELIFR